MALPLNAKNESHAIACDYVKAEQERRAIRAAILNIHRRHVLKLVASK